jgi:hypothetical protein
MLVELLGTIMDRMNQNGSNPRVVRHRNRTVNIVLREHPANATTIFDALSALPADFLADGRDDTPPQERESF